MANTGYKAWYNLERYNKKTGVATGETKPNIDSDPDYVEPIYDTTECPLYDNINPTISSFTASTADDNSFDIYWTISDNVAVTKIEIYYKLISSSTYTLYLTETGSNLNGSSQTDVYTPQSGNNSYHTYIKVYDAAGNSTVSIIRTVDTVLTSPTLYQQQLTYNASVSACDGTNYTTYYHDGHSSAFADFAQATKIYSNSSGSITAPVGHYSNGAINRYWNGTNLSAAGQCDFGGIGV